MTFAAEANAYLDFGYNPDTGACSLGQWTGTDVLEFHVDDYGSSYGIYVIDALGSFASYEFFMDGAPVPNEGWTPNYSGDRNLAWLSPNTAITITVVQRDPQSAVLATFSGTFTVAQSVDTFTLQVADFQAQ